MAEFQAECQAPPDVLPGVWVLNANPSGRTCLSALFNVMLRFHTRGKPIIYKLNIVKYLV